MKKSLLLALGAMMAMPSFAQDDVTHYIKNAGFDEDLTWQADGSKKDIVDQTNVLSDRSIAGIAADNSVYALVNPSTPKKRGDGRTLEATNGFIGQVQGWTVETNQTFPKCEWVYFGTVPYALGSEAIPIADDGNTYLTVPEKPADFSGDDNIGFAYLRAGWGGRAVYKQVVELPCAEYRLEYWAININPSASKGKNLSKVTCRKDVFVDETGFNDTEWTLHTIEFTPTSEFTIEFGFESEGGSGGNPFLCIDGIKLYKIGDADPVKILESDLIASQENLYELLTQAGELGLDGLVAEIEEFNVKIDDAISNREQAEMEAVFKEAEEKIALYNEAIEAVPAIQAMIRKMQNLSTNNYPGQAEFQAAIERLSNYLEKGTAENLLGAVEEGNAAIFAYVMSQAENATAENPADFTMLIKSPWFIKSEAEPTLEDGYYTFPNEFNEENPYIEGSASSPDLTSEGWYRSGAEGGDQRLNWKYGRSCWNAWNNNFTTTIGVAQDLENLPNGYYRVSADLITQFECENDQHVFVKTTAEKVISDPLTEGLADYSTWTTLTTTEAAIVVDGKLTIGAEGTGTGEGSKGWFLVTNFKLYYDGPADAAAVQNKYNALVSSSNEFANGMHLAMDREAFQNVIAANSSASDLETIPAAMNAINEARVEADKSEAKYLDYLPADETIVEGKTLRVVAQTLQGEGYGAAQEIMQFAYDQTMGWINGPAATYTEFDATVDLMKNYLNVYTPVVQSAAELASKVTGTAKSVIDNVIASQKNALTAEMLAKEAVNELVAELKKVMAAVEKQNAYDDPNATDYTVFILNPKAEAADGWSFEMGNGDGNGRKSGQWFDGSNTAYFDSYNSGGLTGFKGLQEIKDMPNGTYTVGLYARTPAEGAYVFTAVSADTAYVEIPLDYYIDESTGEQAIASDKYGPVWEAAKAAYEATGDVESIDFAIYNANDGAGCGWKYMEIENVVVINHELAIGMVSGSIELRKTEKDFGGNWFSVGGWTLKLTAKGDNSGWNGPLADGIEMVNTDAQVADGVYSLNGVKMAKMQRGLNIVINNGKAVKMMVK